MKLKNLAFIFTAGMIAILYCIVDLLSYIFIEKGLLLYLTVGLILLHIVKWLLTSFLVF